MNRCRAKKTVMLATQSKVYILVNGEALEAFAADRSANIIVEPQDHVRLFHQYFFSLDPDDHSIRQTIGKGHRHFQFNRREKSRVRC